MSQVHVTGGRMFRMATAGGRREDAVAEELQTQEGDCSLNFFGLRRAWRKIDRHYDGRESATGRLCDAVYVKVPGKVADGNSAIGWVNGYPSQ